MLFNYDERTWQLDLAPEEKAQALGALPDSLLQALFANYTTINTDLFNHLTWRFRNLKAGIAASDPLPSPCIFLPIQRQSSAPTVPPEASDELRTLLRAEHWLGGKTDKRKEGVEIIASLLRNYHRGSDWSRAHYGALAIKASLSDGDVEKAKDILNLALQSDPRNPQLRYLSRLINRTEFAHIAQARAVKLSSR
jgi:hypothetical protein